MRAKRLNPLFREAEASRQREKRSQQRLSKDEQRLKDPRYIAAESAFKMHIDAVDPGLYRAGRVGDTNKDTTNRRKRIIRCANNKIETDLNKNMLSFDVTPLLIEHCNIPNYEICKPSPKAHPTSQITTFYLVTTTTF